MQGNRYLNLDGLRGVAAVAVCFWHAHQLGVGHLQSAYLAVDLFFLMSGFVLEAAYGRRLQQGLGALAFFKLRLIRLYPLYISGVILLLVYFIVSRHFASNDKFTLGFLASSFLLSALFVPGLMRDPGYFLFPLSPPAWSLFLELAINCVFGTKWGRRSNAILFIVCAVSAVLLAFAAYNFRTLDLGWNWSTAVWGVPRVTFSFVAGMLLYRVKGRIESVPQVPPIILPFLALGLFALPSVDAAPAVIQWLAIVVGFPALLVLAVQRDAQSVLGGAYTFMGDVSYPLYALHVPIFRWINGAAQAVGVEPMVTWWLGWLGVLVAVAVSALALKVYDIPMRGALMNRLRSAQPARRRSKVGKA